MNFEALPLHFVRPEWLWVNFILRIVDCAVRVHDGVTFEHTEAQPLVAAGASALTFAVGAALPLTTAALVPEASISLWVTTLSLMFLALLGAVGARAGGAPILRGVLRVTFWGAVAMAVTALVGKLFGAVI